jgi:lambda repressor-like predicted transcriptional regulator
MGQAKSKQTVSMDNAALSGYHKKMRLSAKALNAPSLVVWRSR